MTQIDTPLERERYVVPALSRLYAGLGDFAFALLRVVAGGALAIHGAPKIIDPFGNIGLVEGLGFYPGAVFSPALALTEFVGGILIALGLLTRPAAFAGMFVLLVTVHFHWVVLEEGYMGAEKSIIWAAALFLYVVLGGGRFSVDRRLGREI